MNFNHKTIIIFIAVLLLGTSIAYADLDCPPYFSEIDSVENAKECLSVRAIDKCGGGVIIVNHCFDKFYLYSENGTLNENLVIINREELIENYQRYKQLKETTGKEYWGDHSLLRQLRFDYEDCYSCPDNSRHCDYDERIKNEIIIDGKNVCDKDNLKSGDVVKYWTVKIFSKEDNQDIIITGRTVYKAPPERSSNEDLSYLPAIFITILLFAISAILLSKAKKHVGLKRNISIVIAMTLIFSGLYFSFLIIVSTFFSHFIRN